MMEATYPAHESYKPSGYDWVGDVPAHWAVEKLGTSLRAVSEKNRPDLPLLSITREKGVIERDLDDEESNHNFIPDDLSGYKVLRVGQFGMNKMKAWQGSYGVSQHTGIVSPAYFIFDFTKEIDPDFFNRAIRSKLYVSFFGSASDGVRIGQWDLNKSRMREIPLLVPPLPEQRAIAAFLDDKCAKIDGAVQIKEDQIALLRERRQIIIQDAVTRGLNPAAPMKDSGIDWIGQIPAHWEVKPLLTEAKIKSRSGRPDLQLLSVYLGLGVVKFDDIEEKRTNATSLDLSAYQIVEPGDLVLNNQQAWRGSVGVSFETGIVSPAYIVLGLSDRYDPEFANFYFRVGTTVANYLINSKGVGTIQRNLYWPKLKRALVTIPPLDEQRAIVEHINSEYEKIENGIAIKERQMAALKEYKTSLINAAVTGKIKVI
jgi:type I restriction enzyme S subunit